MATSLRKHDAAAAALIGRMSLRQKIGQLVQPERMAISPDEVRQHHIGSVLSGGGSAPGDNAVADWVEMNEAYWRASLDKPEGEVAVPIIYGVDAVHGHNNVQGATIFPHNIGLGAANDPDLVKRIARVTALEILATGVDWTFAPTLAVAQDAHWGRMYESYAERAALVASYAGPFVDGLQGDLGDAGVAACAKHWVGDGGTTFGVDQGETTVDWETLRDVHIAPYRPALDAGVLSVMVSFSSWNGDKCHGHAFLLTEYLKGELGFDGVIVSDWDGIEYLDDDFTAATRLAVNAGIDMFMLSEKWLEFIDALESLVAEGQVSEARIDDAVLRVLRMKLALGLFDKPSPIERALSNSATFGCAEHREVAREAVRKSLVLLKNDDALLPLSNEQRILVAGKSAHSLTNQCGGFTVGWQGLDETGLDGGTSFWEAFAAAVPEAELSEDGSAVDPSRHDVAVVVIGEIPYAEGLGDIREGDDVIVQTGSQVKGLMKVLEPYGGSLRLTDLHPEDLACLEKIAAAGVPIVTILLSGRPLLVDRELALSSAFVAAWLPGSEGAGIVDVLLGDHDFQGRLSFSWPSDEAGTGHARNAEHTLFPYGYGLSQR